MIVCPELRALRGDDTPQRDAQQASYEAIAAWKSRPEFERVAAELSQLAAGLPLARCPVLTSFFSSGSAEAAGFVETFVHIATQALGDAPLAHLPLRHFTDGFMSTLLLARSGPVTLSLVALDGQELAGKPPPSSISFGPNETWELILAGNARSELVTCQPTGPRTAELTCKDLHLQPGLTMMRNGQREARILRAIEGTLVSLRLQRRRAEAGPIREYSLGNGALIHQAAGNPRDSRIEMMLALLGRMKRQGAAPAMAGIALGEASPALRWQALRECLALDTSVGFEALCAVAACSEDSLAGPAGALRAQLIEAHPQLQELTPCPA